MNFDQAGRNLLEESVGYERVVLKLALQIREEFNGLTSPLKIVLNDAPPHELHQGFMSFVGAGPQIAVIRSLSPLLFVTAFKLLDMVLEWVLWQNGRKPKGPFWTFRQKAEELGKGGLVYPDFLATEPKLEAILVALFLRFWPHRNAVVHDSWGKESDGDLCFDFLYQDQNDPARPLKHVTETLTLEDLLLLADFAVRMGEYLVNPANQTPVSIDTLKWLCDKLQSFHGSVAFGIVQPRHFEFVRRTSLSTVDLKAIRDEIVKHAGAQPFSFHLTIEQVNSPDSWQLTDLDCVGVDILRLADLDSFKR